MRRAAAALLLLAAPVAAQDAALVAQMAAINAAAPPPAIAGLTPELLSRTQTAAKAEGRCVPASVTVDALAPATASDDALSAITAGKLKNAWTTSAHALGCPGARPERFLVLQLPDDSIRIVGVVAGTTLTGYAQMRSAAHVVGDAALAASQRLDPLCTKAGMDILFTEAGKQHPGLGPDFYGVRMKGSWDEVWTLSACSGHALVPVTFTADGKRGADAAVDAKSVRFARP